MVTISRRFTVVTPVFGGGVRIDKTAPHHKEIDPVTPVRGASVRGQLRFWWRATHGCTCSSIEEMREREGALWGAASKAGRVSLTIRVEGEAEPATQIAVYESNERGGIRAKRGMEEVAYGAFPLQPPKEASNKDAGSLSLVGSTYVVSLRVPQENRAEVDDALTAWTLFGAIGGRGRRGFGAVHSPDVVSDAAVFVGGFKHLSTLEGVPSLHNAQLVTKEPPRRDGTAQMAAWSYALGRLQAFRQGPEIGRNRGQSNSKVPGRSRWPEPELIREKTRRRSAKHQALGHVSKAPRAIFGLPIITHFKDKSEGDPTDTKFVPAAEGPEPNQQDRLASPLILRPLRIGGKWKAACLLMADPGRGKLRVALDDGRTRHPVEWELTAEEAEQIRPMQGFGADVLTAFLKFFAK